MVWRMVALLLLLGGCVAVQVVDTAVSITTTAAETAVDITAGAVDLVIGDDEEGD